MGTLGLRTLLMGTPLGDRHGEERVEEELNLHLSALAELIPKEYGDSDACKEAVMEIKKVIEGGNVTCKRALMLYGLAKQRAICDYWEDQDSDSAELARDLSSRALPFTVPRFLKTSAQRPDAFVTFNLMLISMWAGEKLGNWPLNHDLPAVKLDE
jgi:hypothetical protein